LASFFLRAGVAVTQGGSQVNALMPRWRGSIIVHKATRIFTMPPIPAENFRHLIKRHPGEPNLAMVQVSFGFGSVLRSQAHQTHGALIHSTNDISCCSIKGGRKYD
jgi:hypothetical protein